MRCAPGRQVRGLGKRHRSLFNGGGATRRSYENYGLIDLGNGRAAHPIREAVIFGSCKHQICLTLERRHNNSCLRTQPPLCTPAVYNAVSQVISDAVGNEPLVYNSGVVTGEEGDVVVIVVRGCV